MYYHSVKDSSAVLLCMSIQLIIVRSAQSLVDQDAQTLVMFQVRLGAPHKQGYKLYDSKKIKHPKSKRKYSGSVNSNSNSLV